MPHFHPPPAMSLQPNAELKLPTELLTSIFELVAPEILVVLMRCSKCFYEICNPLLYKQVHLHTPTQLVALSENQKASRMLETTELLVIDDFALYLEAWGDASVRELSKPFYHLLRVLRTTTSLHSLKITQSYVPTTFSKRADWDEEYDYTSELLRTAGDPEFLPNLTLISVFSPAQAEKSWFEALCYDRVVECYSVWNSSNLYAKIFPALESTDAIARGPRLSPLVISQLASHPNGHLSGRDVGRLIRQSLDLDSCSRITHLGLLLQFPGVVLHGEPSLIHNSFTWMKDVISRAGCPQLQGIHVRFQSRPLDWAAGLDTQHQGLKELQKISPELISVGLSSTKMFWKRWVPTPGEARSYSTLPFWTPCPIVDPGTLVDVRAILVWWLNALGLKASEMQDRKIMKDFAKQLSIAMHERWDFVAPTEATLHGRLLSHF
ncbi:hypothetical protein B0J17DRAFT_716187 [Rhizoctonia solani]|nr:hypothetical protein B0J17DRAFT_716187 [Rhizoctonia solani]